MAILMPIITHTFALILGASVVAIIAAKKIHNIREAPKYTIPRDKTHTNL